MPAMNKAAVQLLGVLNREAMETARSISNPEFRDIMTGLINANSAVIDADANGKPQEAMILLWKLWLEHKQPPDQAKWNTPINFIWKMKHDLFVIYWDRLAEFFSGDESVRYNAGLWMLNAHKYENAAAHLRAALVQSHPDLRAYCELSSVYKQTERLEDEARAEAECRKQVPAGDSQ